MGNARNTRLTKVKSSNISSIYNILATSPDSLTTLTAQNATLTAQNATLTAQIASLTAQVANLTAQIANLTAQIANLTTQDTTLLTQDTTLLTQDTTLLTQDVNPPLVSTFGTSVHIKQMGVATTTAQITTPRKTSRRKAFQPKRMNAGEKASKWKFLNSL
jgi:septal ring factor EnvC (AmiA/AmiB activator)